MEDVTFRVVEIDGVLADVRSVFINLATAVLDRPVEVGDVEPPHTVSRMGQAAGLSTDQIDLVRKTIYELTDFWAGLPVLDVLDGKVVMEWNYPIAFHARRLQTRGRPVLLQTIEWLIRQGYENPVVWIEED